jgi:D-amino-acid dehydrogenase
MNRPAQGNPVVVLGAGLLGISTAYYLARSGAAVTVIDRQPGPALETSFANGGQISANHATPWAAPGTPWKALKWLGRIDAPLLFHPRLDTQLLAWLGQFLRNCTRKRMVSNIERALRLALYSREQLALLRGELGLHYDQLTLGILHIFRNPDEHAAALRSLDLMNRLGCRREPIDADACVAMEPALASVRQHLTGGIFSPDDESGDAHQFARGLANACAGLGVQFRFATTITGLQTSGTAVTGIETSQGLIRGDRYVVALGSYSTPLLRTAGLRLPVYPAKGYSVTLPVPVDGEAPRVSLIDDEFKMVYSRLGERLRIAGTAEFDGYNAAVNPRRARFLLGKAMELFPRCGAPEQAEFWAGLRPSTPDGVPVIGRTRYANLFLNTGHGTLGWTMACGSGRAVADLVAGRAPAVSLDGLELSRFA